MNRIYRARILTAGLFFILLPLLCASCQDRPQLTPLDSGAVIVAFGDSLTYGTGAESGENYPARLQALIGHRIVNAGVPGELSDKGLKRLPTVLDRNRPALLILCHGGNDILRRLGAEQTAENIREMIRITRRRGVEVVLIGVPQLGLFLSPAPFYGKIAKELSLPYEGEILSDILSDRSLKSDTVHPNAEGYRQMARAVADLLEESGAI